MVQICIDRQYIDSIDLFYFQFSNSCWALIHTCIDVAVQINPHPLPYQCFSLYRISPRLILKWYVLFSVCGCVNNRVRLGVADFVQKFYEINYNLDLSILVSKRLEDFCSLEFFCFMLVSSNLLYKLLRENERRVTTKKKKEEVNASEIAFLLA